MQNRIKVVSYYGDKLEHVTIGVRKYELTKTARVTVNTDWGVFRLKVKKGFIWDARSGGPLVDFFLPHQGKHEDQLCWFVHDIFGHSIGLSFQTTNEILRQMIVLSSRSKWVSDWAYRIVSASDSWFGGDTSQDVHNRKKILFDWSSK